MNRRAILRSETCCPGKLCYRSFRDRLPHGANGDVSGALCFGDSQPRSPWQNPYVERVIGSLRRDCLDHAIILGEDHPRRVVGNYVRYYNGARTHLSLAKDAPVSRRVYGSGLGRIVSRRHRGGLHHEYLRVAAWLTMRKGPLDVDRL